MIEIHSKKAGQWLEEVPHDSSDSDDQPTCTSGDDNNISGPKEIRSALVK